MDALFDSLSSSDPPRATLARWWQAVSKSIRDSFDHKAIPEDLKAAMKGRARLYFSAVGEASDVMDLAVGAPVVGGLAPESPDFVDLAAEAPDVSSLSAKRPCRSVSRSRIVATSLSSSSQVEPHSGGGRSVLTRPQSGRGGRSHFRGGFCRCSLRVFGRGVGASESASPTSVGATVSNLFGCFV